jgi:hypothetical protein
MMVSPGWPFIKKKIYYLFSCTKRKCLKMFKKSLKILVEMRDDHENCKFSCLCPNPLLTLTLTPEGG